ncbi:DNA repair protein [Dokdonia pacifica]|uniref:RadC-like JAB domain-containing protein n=1 Tax=Dokdonia pacifica TaxID=1627892 RepID=A0A238VWD3_9FLAO|nr:JAB domain-containing protein [Dokdonia pacifica]GGG16945.1 DNA repair protein [Dokdonia pacifica]SNR38596.1 RadC-like JAB domain-containing protein [Dokdonia pacifica]
MKAQVNEIKISYKGGLKSSMWQKISNSQDAAELLYEDWDKDSIGIQESFKVVLLNNSNKVKGVYQLSQGGITGTLVDVRILFAVILKSLSVGIILTHNHPSGKLVPSEADKQLTNKIKNASKLFDIKLLDHLILIPDGNYYSFSDNGLL